MHSHEEAMNNAVWTVEPSAGPCLCQSVKLRGLSFVPLNMIHANGFARVHLNHHVSEFLVPSKAHTILWACILITSWSSSFFFSFFLMAKQDP